MTSPLATQVTAALPPDSGIRVGVVVAIESTTTLTVNVGGGVLTGLPYLDSYFPAAGDNVQIIRMDATWLVVGTLGPSPGTILAGSRGTSTTTITPINTVETNLPFLSFTASVKLNQVYEIFASILVQQSIATDAFTWQIRRDTAVTGTQVGFGRFSTGFTANGGRERIEATFEPLQDENVTFFFSAIRASGTGDLTVIPRLAGGNSQLASYSRMTFLSLGINISGSGWEHS